MQLKDWNDLRYLLAVGRSGSFATASRSLKVDATTVSRHLDRLARTAGGALIEREAGGRLALTELGQVLLRHAEAMEREFEALAEDLGLQTGEVAGEVRVTSVPLIVNRLLAPALAGLLGEHPQLRVELIPESRDLDLTHREADIALRLARPTTGGLKVKSLQVGTLTYAVYAPRNAEGRERNSLPWIGYGEAMAELPQAKWIARAAERGGQSGLRVHDVETALQAVLAGMGKTLLPKAVGDREPSLARLDGFASHALPRRDVWLLAREDRLGLRRVQAVREWIRNEVAFSGPSD